VFLKRIAIFTATKKANKQFQTTENNGNKLKLVQIKHKFFCAK